MSAAFNPVQSEGPIVFRFDACGIAKRFRYAAIIAALDTLREGETMRFVNDHDPPLLLDQVDSARPDPLGWPDLGGASPPLQDRPSSDSRTESDSRGGL